MTEIISCQDVIYAFSKDNRPIKTVAPGSQITIETYDCFQNQIRSNNTEINSIDWERINPATGPIFIETAQPGDILSVKIDRIELANEGVMAVGPNLGVMGGRIEHFEAKIIPIQNNKAIFNDTIQIPLNPMIGVIGVAPSGDPVSCGTPGSHGGNMDTKLITTGATLYFPVFVEGALFALGDLHAAMGDGEIGVSGIEIPGKVTVTLDVIKGHSLKNPVLISEEGIATIVSAQTLDEAVKTSVEEMIDLLLPHTDLTLNHLTMVMSAIGQTQISQVVDPLVTARFFVPKWFLDAYHIHLFQ
ncbi:acetamidase/formamidase family protein [Parageobacillus thermoglucosidasius]|uniref:acetamidase/formamidase family protein n=1 Tax=Parageobacillus thermoglucosidasius TaxID=1426 RepID=UPI00242D9BBE|nr:acetamidase/formamidase family protein [Parageobacillus thermoglucosidasius]MBY6269511.1 acetamidase [Parageobacillus thermoglucosidasius]